MKRLIQGAGLAAALGLAGGFGGVANAAVLTFSGNICSGGGVCGHFSPIDQSYGDIAGVDVQYNRNVNNIGYTTGAVGSELLAWDTAYNDLLDVAFGDSGGGTPMIFLRPTGGTVTLNGLDLGAWPNAVNG